MNESTISEYNIGSSDFFINVEDIKETPDEIKAYIPKLMPYVELGDEPKTNIACPINRSIFVNDKKCDVQGLKSVVMGQNFVTLTHHNNEKPNFRSKAELRNGEYIVPKHNKFALDIQQNDIETMFFTGKE